jgi:HSP20 family protein
MNTLINRDPFNELLRGFFIRPVDFDRDNAMDSPQMRVDVKETQEGYQVSAELPGINKEDIHVQIDGPVVSISAERKQERQEKDGLRVLRTERYFGKVSRSFQLSQDVDESTASAKFADGVLELTLPKKGQSHAKRLTIS